MNIIDVGNIAMLVERGLGPEQAAAIATQWRKQCAENKQLESFIEFVLRWITDEKVTASECVSIIRHHPHMQGMLARRATHTSGKLGT